MKEDTDVVDSDLDLDFTEAELDAIAEAYMGFTKTTKALASKGAKNPEALAAYIGRKKYGKEKFQAAAAAGKKLG
jgi:L-amino acid N-acyltransferase YncA